MKFIVKSLKPRNPLVVPSLQREAGANRRGIGSRRRLAEVALQRGLDRLIRPSP